ncbi:DNA-3-methyladenine glycosylase I [Nesterenkonia flava]|uniref:DNA-3-methyladenine glycosylase I n=1 Tax=Nesterenkonia flava TaxID=469799 RepID=A0ABU1FVF2_9MICC|nr:DNA-3-methyladenine glycosylase I [Nesterenkonia flava]MDR5712648.1 DNA-3-methyladenine glycosylase I [Nesterenkonia flava]
MTAAAETVTEEPPRCPWAGSDAAMQAYHDTEWGFPVADDRRLFEKLCLESFQSGLSWRTILHKRDNFRAAFADFDISKVAAFDDDAVERLLANAGIIRNRAKIEAAINNARQAQELISREGSLAGFLWTYEPSMAELGAPQELTTVPSAAALATVLKKQGWKFLGPTAVFAFMQSMGLVNDHTYDCHIRQRVAKALAHFARP